MSPPSSITREQTPFDLEPMNVEAGTLAVGDYSVAGLGIGGCHRTQKPAGLRGNAADVNGRGFNANWTDCGDGLFLRLSSNSVGKRSSNANWRGKLTSGTGSSIFRGLDCPRASAHSRARSGDSGPDNSGHSFLRGSVIDSAKLRHCSNKRQDAASKREASRQKQKPNSGN